MGDKITKIILLVFLVCVFYLGTFFAALYMDSERARENMEVQATMTYLDQLRSNARIKVLQEQVATQQKELLALKKELGKAK